ncbi:MAG: crossover junction endodeoxyribonuclease RuvC [Alphaproteobacteria bacterium]|uniref:Crossover junction endodeoxyribonuclease RuvC n=1 Tax=PS1 clade bacterium TaxID=2175152 RepID=A0A368DQ38_9PROT|nr:crossover junction endodeoxyribonuclease RuvC [Rhodobiaceae bacterium]OUT75404.1 MAG: crossover junction endodeoxyribonuclease RuvC [Rhizobiales bacterium TMED25]RCL73939.1 MAG: crossover junction endodeoxyribonuclease RuvC [PS1 clade bacterium]
MQTLKKIIGIDPGLINTGWGLIEVEGNVIRHIDHGLIKIKTSDDIAVRLLNIYEALILILSKHMPDEASIEKTFVNKNPNSSLKLGHARGVILLALAKKKLTCFEYAPNQIKKSIVGRGHADKDQIATMVTMLLSKKIEGNSDVSDALAIAITHAYQKHNKIAEFLS